METKKTLTGDEHPQYAISDTHIVHSGRRGGRAVDAAEIEKRCRENATNRVHDAEKLTWMPARTGKKRDWQRKTYLMGVLGDATRAKANGDLTPDQFEAVKAGVFARAEHLSDNAKKADARRALRRKK